MSAASYIPGAVAGSYPIREGNRVRPLIDSKEIFTRLGEAAEGAQKSLWITVAFLGRDFTLPGRGSVFDLLDRATRRGVDVRLLMWRPNPQAGDLPIMFRGTPDDRELIRARAPQIKVRWDRAIDRFCQHQKSWVIDAGLPSEIAFVGGINLTVRSSHHHDLYLEIDGPAVTDVRHNFVQRWNESSERGVPDGSWNCAPTDLLPFPQQPPAPRGAGPGQIQRLMHAGRYSDGHPVPGGRRFDIAGGERSVAEQYVRAIEAARSTIYLENQSIPIMEIAAPLARALERGVDVVLLVPTFPEKYVFAARLNPAEQPRFEGMELLARHPNFLMSGIGGRDAGDSDPVYVHAKVMLVDDAWATIGSCNLHAFSLNGHCEMNASFWDAVVVRDLRRRLLSLRVGEDTGSLDDRRALAFYRTVAEDNRGRMERGEAMREGLAVALRAERYGVTG
ncbi:MAG: phospholipase D-like domain-containing protein [Reyranella sp.]